MFTAFILYILGMGPVWDAAGFDKNDFKNAGDYTIGILFLMFWPLFRQSYFWGQRMI